MGHRGTRTFRYSEFGLAYWIGAGFVAGAASVLLFHQGALALLHWLDLTQRVPYSMHLTEPFGVPQVWSLVFWGGVWGALFGALLRRLDRGGLVAASLLLGAVLPTLVAWFVVAPLKGQPIAAGYQPLTMAFGVILNGAWGLGTGLILALLAHASRVERRRDERRQIDRRRPKADRRRASRRYPGMYPEAV